MIPKIIHYCWFGSSELPIEVQNRISDWKEKLPDYEFQLWNEESFDINISRYTEQAYSSRKFAYVTDYVRLYALKEFGGIYMDTDVDVIKPLDPLLENRAFTGCESPEISITGTMGSEKNHPWINDLFEYYTDLDFIVEGKPVLQPNTKFITQITMEKYGWKQNVEMQLLKDDVVIYPFDFLCAKDWSTGKLSISENTYTVHNFSGSWLTKEQKIMKTIKGKIKSLLEFVIGQERMTKLLNKKRGM